MARLGALHKAIRLSGICGLHVKSPLHAQAEIPRPPDMNTLFQCKDSYSHRTTNQVAPLSHGGFPDLWISHEQVKQTTERRTEFDRDVTGRPQSLWSPVSLECFGLAACSSERYRFLGGSVLVLQVPCSFWLSRVPPPFAKLCNNVDKCRP